MKFETPYASQRVVEDLVQKLRRRQVIGSHMAALETVFVLRQVVSKARFSNIGQLVDIIRSVGRRLVEAQPKGGCPAFLDNVGHSLQSMLHNRTLRW